MEIAKEKRKIMYHVVGLEFLLLHVQFNSKDLTLRPSGLG